MIKFNDKPWNELDDVQKISYVKDNLVDPARQERRATDLKWYFNVNFMEGNHYIQYNSTTKSIETPPRKRGTIRLTINKTRSAMRSVKNYTTRYQPKAEVVPGDTDEETIINARRCGKLLDYLHVQLHLRNKIRKLVDKGLIHSVGFWELGWDDEAMGGLGQVTVGNHDPFDIFLPLTARVEGPVIHSPFIAKVISRDTNELKADEKYPKEKREKIVPDTDSAYSEVKARVLRKKGMKEAREEGQETTLLYEVMLYDPEGNDKGGNIKRVTFASDQLLLEEDLELTEYNIYAFQPEPSDMVYGPAWVEDLVPVNKAIDRLQSQVLDYNNKMLRGRYRAPKGHGVNRVAAGRGGPDIEILEYNPGFELTQVEMHPLPLTIHRQISDLNSEIEHLSGAHEASIGALPAGARSGKTLEALQAADSNNLAGIRESLEDFLSVVYSRMLDIVADKYVASRVIKLTEPEEGGNEYIRVMGAGGGEKAPKGTTIVNKDNEVIVKIGSWLGYTNEAQRETLLELAKLGVVPAEEVLRQFEFPNIQELSKKAREQRLEEHELKAEIAGRRGEGGAGGAPAAPAPDVALADQENARMMQGEDLPPTPNASPEHSQAHVDFLRSPDAQGQGAMIIEQHVRGELEGQR